MKKPVIIISIFLAISIALTVAEVVLSKSGTSLLHNNILILTLFNVNIILMVVLLLLLSRNVVKYIFDRQQTILGNKFRTKLIASFVGFSLIPSILLFIVASGLITNSINNWFNIQVEKSLKNSFDVAQSYYEKEKDKTMHSAEVIAKRVSEEISYKSNQKASLIKIIEDEKADYKMSGIELFDKNGKLLGRSIDKFLVKRGYSGASAEFVKKGLRGEKSVVVKTLESGDAVIAVSPVYSGLPEGEGLIGAVAVVSHIRKGLVEKMVEITRLYEEYNQMALLKKPIKSSYILSFLTITLLIMFSATWFGYYLAKNITTPIQSLAEATQAVAEGNLDVKVDASSRDEIGVLINSFNKMTWDLKQGKSELEEAYSSLRDSNIEIEQRRAYMETVLENIATGVISVDKNGYITTFNRAAETVLDMPKEAIKGKNFQEILSRIPADAARDIIRRIRGGGGTLKDEEIQFNINNRSITLRLKMTALYDADGNFSGNVIVFDDLSELIKAQRIAAWQEVAKRLAHEIKNPLTPIQLCTERLRKKHYERAENYDKIFDDCTGTIINEVNALKMMLDEFSGFARMPVAKPTINDLNSVIKEVLSLYREAHREITFTEDLSESMPGINIDREQFKRVFVNLFKNAVEAINGTGRVFIKTEYDSRNSNVRVEIADDGAGVPPEDRERIFIPYFSRKKSGTGLGLAIVNRIVSDHNGRILVSDNVPRGTRFVIELPV
ncbi:MAG: HAMP domain-containing protein [Nitrospirae bacterium]|nr:HAMP domain-containing protein [Nitrospirota bacterium]